jgi:hypothetical protein
MSALEITIQAPDQSDLTDIEKELLARLIGDFLADNFGLRAESVAVGYGTDRSGYST